MPVREDGRRKDCSNGMMNAIYGGSGDGAIFADLPGSAMGTPHGRTVARLGYVADLVRVPM